MIYKTATRFKENSLHLTREFHVKYCSKNHNRTHDFAIAHFENERWPGSRVTAQAIVGLFGGTLNAMNNSQRPPKPSQNR